MFWPQPPVHTTVTLMICLPIILQETVLISVLQIHYNTVVQDDIV